MQQFAQVDGAGLVAELTVSEAAPAAIPGCTVMVLAGELPARPQGIGWRFRVADGFWVQAAPPAVAEAYAAAMARDRRRSLLAESDWTQSPDSPLSDAVVAEWAAHRQKLRDISLQAGWPFVINWPVPPGNAA